MSLQDSWLYCPRGGKRLVMDLGQDITGNEAAGLTVEHRCLCCERAYVERGPSTPREARRTSPAVHTAAARLLALRLGGTVVPMKADTMPWPAEDWPDAPMHDEAVDERAVA